jgi:hypothetical protein
MPQNAPVENEFVHPDILDEADPVADNLNQPKIKLLEVD